MIYILRFLGRGFWRRWRKSENRASVWRRRRREKLARKRSGPRQRPRKNLKKKPGGKPRRRKSGLTTNWIIFCFLFCDESMTPASGKDFSLPFLPATSSSWTLEGLLELTRRPSKAPDSPRALLPELQRNKDIVMWAALGAEVPGHCLPTQTLIVRLLKTHYFTPFLDFEKSIE